MKASKETVESIAKDMRTVMDHMGIPKELEPGAGMLWNLWHKIYRDRHYGDSHPAYKRGIWVRVIPYIGEASAASLYPDNTNDQTMTTALRAAYSLV